MTKKRFARLLTFPIIMTIMTGYYLIYAMMLFVDWAAGQHAPVEFSDLDKEIGSTIPRLVVRWSKDVVSTPPD